MVDCLSPEGAPYRSVAGKPHAGAPLIAAMQCSHCVFGKVCSSRISLSGKSGTSLFLSCEGIVTSSSSVGVPNSTFPYSDSFQSPVSCCIIFFTHGKCLHSALPRVPPELNTSHGHQNVADSRGEGKQQKQLLVTVKSFIQ